MIPYSKHFIDKDDIDAVVDVLKNKSITQGELIGKLEKKISKYVKCKYAVAVTSCSAGLHLSSSIIGMNNKNVVTSPITFASTASSILHSGGKLKFIDISNKNINIDLDKVNELNINVNTVIPIHFSGAAVELKKFRNKNPKIKIIEDSAHALGAKYKTGDMVGSCKFSDISVFSLHPAKTITAGEGGIITTNSKDYYDKLKLLSNNGIQKDKEEFKIKKYKNDMWYYEVQKLGFHYRITDFQCALAISQLNKVDVFLKARKKIVKNYDDAFKSFINLSPAVDYVERKSSSNHLYVVRVNFKKIKKSRNMIMSHLKNKGIITQVHYIPIINHPLFKKYKNKNEKFKNTKSYYDEALSLPLYYSLREDEQEKVINELKNIIE